MSTELSSEAKVEEAKETVGRSARALVPPICLAYAIVYNAAAVVSDPLLVPNYTLASLAALILYSYVKRKPWTVWASVAYVPLALAEAIPTFEASIGLLPASAYALAFEVSLVAFAIATTISAGFIVLDRRRFKQRVEPEPKGSQKEVEDISRS